MAVNKQIISGDYAIYNGDCIEVMGSLPDSSIHLSLYSPPFGGMYVYSSDDRDLSNADDYEKFFDHYEYVIRELYRITLPGRITAVHTTDIIKSNSGCDHLIDLSGDIIRLHEKNGFGYVARYCVWKEPLLVRNRTMMKKLAHRTIVDDSSRCGNASADYLLIFRRKGDNKIPIAHPVGMLNYAGERLPPTDILQYRGWTGKQTENRYSHWIWRQYASAFWDDVRVNRILPFRQAKDEEDEKHVHPLQLDVIDRALVLWSNPGEIVLTPFMGVGSEVYGSIMNGRKAIGIELKPSYFKQAVKNIEAAATGALENDQHGLDIDSEDNSIEWPSFDDEELDEAS